MITTKTELRRVLDQEKSLYIPTDCGDRWYAYLINKPCVKIWHWQKLLRKSEYWFNNRHRSPLHYLRFLWIYRRKNNAGRRLGIEISENTFDVGLKIHHEGNIVVNGNATVGRNCILHGTNCIGNRGVGEGTFDTPVIGDNVDFGVGACAIGGITIASDTIVGAGAVVVKSSLEPGVTLVGVPARPVRRTEQ